MKKSTYLKQINYNPNTKEMTVTFTDGAIVKYSNISLKKFNAIDGAKDSVGEVFHRLVVSRHRSYVIVKSAA